ncbi:hypothetical protein FPY71_03040 [Aureimonas fodinaquatilis]|uniref:Uncharacterized protein n=1 Tax=Aureimonas fodinaquatilis TaxID=2565783 RepID=A0A5B0E1V5_9HYPH|nr:hypothetical protein [Aureimonas fodinaquatilis]KAA0972105.1 hypothetical protein FPY71_03040 [Aureimonas fodinaquatilis]
MILSSTRVYADDSPAVSRCEDAIVGAIQNPGSYQRGAVSRSEQDNILQALTIEFEASNIYGQPIGARGICYFRMVSPSPLEQKNCPQCQIFVLDGLSIAGAFRPGDPSEQRIISQAP